MEKKTAHVRNLLVNTDLPQCQLPNEVFTKAINFRPENNSLVSIHKSAIAPAGASKPWSVLPDLDVILPEILRLDFNNNLIDTAADPDPDIYWTVHLWDGTPTYVEGPTAEDLAVTNCCFFISPSIYDGFSPPVVVEISLLITLLSTVNNNLLAENTSVGQIIELNSAGHILYQGIDTGQAVNLNEYFTLLFQYSSVTEKTELFFKNGATYVSLGVNTSSPVLTWNFEVNSPWGRDMTSERVASIVAYRGLIA